jgi:prophage regulatory protein
MDKLLTLKQVCEIVSFQRSYIYNMMSENKFPRPKKYGRNNRWFESDIEQWLIKEKEEHDNEQGVFTHVGKAIDDLLS